MLHSVDNFMLIITKRKLCFNLNNVLLHIEYNAVLHVINNAVLHTVNNVALNSVNMEYFIL